MVTWALQRLAFEWLWEAHGDMSITDALIHTNNMLTAYYEGGDHCMIGTLCEYITQDPPIGALPLDGGTYDRVDYPNLYAVLDPIYIDDADHFTLPDSSGRAFLGSGNGDGLTARALGDLGGSETVTLDESEMPEHHHAYQPPAINPDIEGPGIPDIGATVLGLPTVTGDTGGDQPHENMPPFLVVHVGVWAK